MENQKILYRGIMAFDGTNFHGFQVQPDKRTVQGEMEQALASILGTKTIVYGAGRTDAGVHALAMPFSFTSHLNIPPQGLIAILNKTLPHDITVLRLGYAPEGFHPRFSTHKKTYRYMVSFSNPNPFLRHHCSFYNYRSADIDTYIKALSYFKGTHDFTSFTKNKEAIDYVRTIDDITFKVEDKLVTCDITSSGFLHNEVRIIVAMALETSRGQYSIEDLKHIESLKNRQYAPKIAPGCGLYLLNVHYDDNFGEVDLEGEAVYNVADSHLI